MNKGFFSFTALSVLIGGLAIIGLLLYGWSTGQSLPLWPSPAGGGRERGAGHQADTRSQGQACQPRRQPRRSKRSTLNGLDWLRRATTTHHPIAPGAA